MPPPGRVSAGGRQGRPRDDLRTTEQPRAFGALMGRSTSPYTSHLVTTCAQQTSTGVALGWSSTTIILPRLTTTYMVPSSRRRRRAPRLTKPWQCVGWVGDSHQTPYACIGHDNRIYIFLGERFSRPLFLRDAMRRRLRIVASLAGALAVDLVVDCCSVLAFNHSGNHLRGSRDGVFLTDYCPAPTNDGRGITR